MLRTGVGWIAETPVVLGLDNGVVRSTQTRKELLSSTVKGSFLSGAM